MQPSFNIGLVTPAIIKTETTDSTLSAAAKLPAVGSVPSVSVLDKSGDIYRLLINGSVFQAAIPIDVKTGELMLARVISQVPFVLALNGLTGRGALTPQVLDMLLNRLGIRNTHGSKKILQILLETDRPVVRSKMEKLLELMERQDLQFGDAALGFLAAFITSDRTDERYLEGGAAGIFQYLPGDLSLSIFERVQELTAKKDRIPLEEQVIENLCLSPDMESIEYVLALKENFTRILRTILLLKSGISDRNNTLFILRELLIKYSVLRSHYYSTGRCPEFIIIRNLDGLSLCRYEFENDDTQGVKLIRIDMEPQYLGPVRFEAIYGNTSMNCSFTAPEESLVCLERESGKLMELLGKTANGRVNISFNRGIQTTGTTGAKPGRINFRA